MKLLLASQGFLTDEIANEVERVVNKNLNEINIAIVNESYLELDREKYTMKLFLKQRDLFLGNITYKVIYGLILFFGKRKKMQIMQQQLGKVKK